MLRSGVMAGKSTRQEWAKRVERWQDSGLTAAEFAAEAGINPRTLTYWKWKLGKERGGRGRRKRSAEPKVEFVEVASLAGAVPAPIELVVDGRYVVRVSSGADVELLSRVLEVLEQRR